LKQSDVVQLGKAIKELDRLQDQRKKRDIVQQLLAKSAEEETARRKIEEFQSQLASMNTLLVELENFDCFNTNENAQELSHFRDYYLQWKTKKLLHKFGHQQYAQVSESIGQTYSVLKLFPTPVMFIGIGLIYVALFILWRFGLWFFE
jgi:hypothetical protein